MLYLLVSRFHTGPDTTRTDRVMSGLRKEKKKKKLSGIKCYYRNKDKVENVYKHIRTRGLSKSV